MAHLYIVVVALALFSAQLVWTASIESEIEQALWTKLSESLKNSDLTPKVLSARRPEAKCDSYSMVPCQQRLQISEQVLNAIPTRATKSNWCRAAYAFLECVRENGCTEQYLETVNMRPELDQECRGFYPVLSARRPEVKCDVSSVVPCSERLQISFQQYTANPTRDNARNKCRAAYAFLDCVRDNDCTGQFSEVMNIRPVLDQECRGVYPALE